MSPGYYFVAPYNTNNDWESHKTPLIEACQVGPHIYDNNGELIWSGACLFRNENGFDFKAIHHGGRIHLSLDDVRGDPSLYGAGIILSDQYQIVKDVQMAEHTNQFDQHEFAVLDNGNTALYVASDLRDMDGESIGLGRYSTTRVHSTGFKEVDLSGGNPKTVFDWQGADHIPLDESTFAWPEEADPYGKGWDYLHMNSVDKFPNGDYLVSFRYTNSLMRLSGKTGDVLWRLGGKKSDFQTGDWVFSRQHHGRVITSNETHTVISFFDNASSSQVSDKGATTAERSSALVVLLGHDPNDKASWTATPIRRFERPDWGYTRLRGSIQLLPGPESPSLEHITSEEWPNSNVFVCWSDHGYATEFSPNGDVVMETRFVSRRFDTYRAFKMVGFVGRPAEPPMLKALVYGDILPGQGTGVGPFTVVYVSWNGATEVRAWRVYGKVVKDAPLSDTVSPTTSSESASTSPTSGSSGLFRFARRKAGSSSGKKEGETTSRSARFAYLGTYHKTGFETAITVPGAVSYLWAEALDSEGKKIGQTSVTRGIVPGVSIASWEEGESTNTTSAAASSSSSASNLSLEFDTDDDTDSLSTDLTLSLSSSPFYSTTEDSPNDASAPIALAPLTFPSAFPHGWGYGDTESTVMTGEEEPKSWWESHEGHKYELTISRNTAAAVVGAMLLLLVCLLAALVWTGVQRLQLRKRRDGAAHLPLSLRRRGLLQGLGIPHSRNASTSSLSTAASPTAPAAASSSMMAGAKQPPQHKHEQPWWRATAMAWRSRRASSRSYELVLDHDEEEIDLDMWDDVNVPFYQHGQNHHQPRPSSMRRNGSGSTAAAAAAMGGREMAQVPRRSFPPPLQGHDLGAGGMRMAVAGHAHASTAASGSASSSSSAPSRPLPLISQIDSGGPANAGSGERHGQAAWTRRLDGDGDEQMATGHKQQHQQQMPQPSDLSWQPKHHKPQPGRYKRGRSLTTDQAEGWVTHRDQRAMQSQQEQQQQQQPPQQTAHSTAVNAAVGEVVDDEDEGWGQGSKRAKGKRPVGGVSGARPGGYGRVGGDDEEVREGREHEEAPLIARVQ